MPQSKSSFQTWDFYSNLSPKDRVGLNHQSLYQLMYDSYYMDNEIISDYLQQ